MVQLLDTRMVDIHAKFIQSYKFTQRPTIALIEKTLGYSSLPERRHKPAEALQDEKMITIVSHVMSSVSLRVKSLLKIK